MLIKTFETEARYVCVEALYWVQIISSISNILSSFREVIFSKHQSDPDHRYLVRVSKRFLVKFVKNFGTFWRL